MAYGYIYLIVNKLNGKTYIGQRKSNKAWNVDKYMGSGVKLLSAKKHYGIKNFEKYLIQYVSNAEEANKQEIFWIAEYRRRGKAEYNIANGGDGGSTRIGRKATIETRKRMSESSYWKGKHHSDETKRKISETKKGKSTWNKGNSMTEDQRRKLSESSYWKGKHLSDETKRKLSESLKGRKRPPRSEEWRKHLSEALKGKKRKPLSEETKRKMSEARKAYWLKRRDQI